MKYFSSKFDRGVCGNVSGRRRRELDASFGFLLGTAVAEIQRRK